MLIFRYIARDLLSSTFAICTVLLLVIISGRFVKYLAQAAAGDLDAGILLAVIGYRLPGFMESILPLAFFLGVLLAYGRFYVQNEMTVMFACGVSQLKLIGYTLIPALFIALLVAGLSFEVSPSGLKKAEALLTAQKERGELDNLVASHFYPLQGGQSVTYAEQVNDSGLMQNVFLAENNPEAEEGKQLVLVVAETGRQHRSGPEQPSYLVLDKGYRIQGVPGRADYQITRFEEYGQRLSQPDKPGRREKADTLPTAELLGSNNKSYIAALQWRFSLPILVLVMTLMAIPLSKTNPRQGRFSKMIPAILIYVIYQVILRAARGAVEDDKLSASLGLWWVHFVFLFIALVLLFMPQLRQHFKNNHTEQKSMKVIS